MPVRLEPIAPRSRVKHSTTEPLNSICLFLISPKSYYTYILHGVGIVLKAFHSQMADGRKEIIYCVVHERIVRMLCALQRLYED